MMLMLALCFSSVASAEQTPDMSGEWVTQAELIVSGEETECDLVFDTIPEELLFLTSSDAVRWASICML